MKLGEKARHYGAVAKYSMKLELQSQMEYPSFLIGWLLANATQFLVGVGVLKVITLQFGAINGWRFEQVVFMYGLGILAHGLAVVLYIQTWYIDGFVRHGGFDRMLLRPMSVYFQFRIHDLNLIGLTDMMPGIGIFIYGSIVAGFLWSPGNVLLLIISVIGQTMIRGGIYLLLGCIGFWTMSKGEVMGMANTMFTRTILYPLNIFNRGIQAFLTFVIPLGFIAYYPASDFLGVETAFSIPGPSAVWAFAIGAALMILGGLVFALGLRRYDSTGN